MVKAGMHNKMKKLLAGFLSLVLVIGTVSLYDGHSTSGFVSRAAGASRPGGVCADTYNGTNAGHNNYYTWKNWSSVVYSYLASKDNGTFMRVQGDAMKEKILVENFDSNFKLQDKRTVDFELPLFGGFCSIGDYNYILSGQENPDEDDNVEVFRVTKYDENWNRISSCGLYGENTTVPFDAGSARFAVCGKYLMVRTCHEMYQSDDGLNHQSNVTFQVDTEAMTVSDRFTGVMNTGYGYVSHSFNQFVTMDGNQMVTLDHGDAYPRSIVLIKYPNDISAGSFVSGQCLTKSMLDLSGEVGDNYTGATAGGLEVSDSGYLAVGTMEGQENSSSGAKNIFVSYVPKDLQEDAKKTIITDCEENSSGAANPFLVKVDGSLFVLIWAEDTKVYYTGLDGEGNKVGEVYSFDGQLSDCHPVLSQDGKIIWYVWEDSKNIFYRIDSRDLSDYSVIDPENEHQFITQNATENSNEVTQTCSNCGFSQSFTVPGSIKQVYWRENSDTGLYWSTISPIRQRGDTIDIMVTLDDDGADVSDYEVLVSDPDVISFKDDRFTVKNCGECTVTIQPVYNPSAAVTETFTIAHSFGSWEVTKKATCTEKGSQMHTCSQCGKTETQETEDPIGHKFGSWVIVKPATSVEDGIQARECSVCGTTESRAIKAGGQDSSMSQSPDAKPDISNDNNNTNSNNNNVSDPGSIGSETDQDNTVSTANVLSKVVSLKLKAGKKAFTARWKKVKGAKGYQYQYALSKKKVGKAKKRTVNKCSLTVKRLKKNKCYYVRVRAYKGTGKNKVYGKWSTIKKIKVKR